MPVRTALRLLWLPAALGAALVTVVGILVVRGSSGPELGEFVRGAATYFLIPAGAVTALLMWLHIRPPVDPARSLAIPTIAIAVCAAFAVILADRLSADPLPLLDLRQLAAAIAVAAPPVLPAGTYLLARRFKGSAHLAISAALVAGGIGAAACPFALVMLSCAMTGICL